VCTAVKIHPLFLFCVLPANIVYQAVFAGIVLFYFCNFFLFLTPKLSYQAVIINIQILSI